MAAVLGGDSGMADAAVYVFMGKGGGNTTDEMKEQGLQILKDEAKSKISRINPK